MPVVRRYVKRRALIGQANTPNIDLAPVAADVTMHIAQAERIAGATFSLYKVLLPIITTALGACAESLLIFLRRSVA